MFNVTDIIVDKMASDIAMAVIAMQTVQSIGLPGDATQPYVGNMIYIRMVMRMDKSVEPRVLAVFKVKAPVLVYLWGRICNQIDKMEEILAEKSDSPITDLKDAEKVLKDIMSGK